uniref:Uncharacterized protein n=2 Tax=Ovis aries TaxID=9940 RepID=A0AC11D3B5_SHEEP
AQAPTPSALDPEGAHSSLLTQGLRTPGPRPARLCTHSSLGVLLPVRTRRGPSSPRRSASGRSGGRTIPRAHGRLWVSGRPRPPRASVAPGSASGVGRHRAGFARSILGPSPCGVRWDPPCGLRRPPGASSSGRSLRGERDHTEVRRTEPRVDAEPGPATARVPSRSPLAPSEAASDTSGMSRGKMTLDRGFGPRAPVPAPPPTTGHGPSRRLRALVGEMPELGAGQLTALGKRSDSYICARKGGTCNLSPCPLYNRIEGTCYKGKAKCCIR